MGNRQHEYLIFHSTPRFGCEAKYSLYSIKIGNEVSLSYQRPVGGLRLEFYVDLARPKVAMIGDGGVSNQTSIFFFSLFFFF